MLTLGATIVPHDARYVAVAVLVCPLWVAVTVAMWSWIAGLVVGVMCNVVVPVAPTARLNVVVSSVVVKFAGGVTANVNDDGCAAEQLAPSTFFTVTV